MDVASLSLPAPPTIYQELERRRVDLKMTRFNVAERAGVSVQSVNNMLGPSCSGNFKFSTVQAIAKALGVKIVIEFIDVDYASDETPGLDPVLEEEPNENSQSQ